MLRGYDLLQSGITDAGDDDTGAGSGAVLGFPHHYDHECNQYYMMLGYDHDDH